MQSFRFLHASDFQLDKRPMGMLEIQDGLVDQLIEATYRAVDSVFDTAIRERVDFVLLSGGILRFSNASPRAIEFLGMQFERLHDNHIPVYWLGGDLEAQTSLPSELRLPKNVHRLPSSRVQTLEIKKKRRTIGYVVGQSAGDGGYANIEDMRVPRDGRFFVGMWYCSQPEELDSNQLDDLGIDYWALGGSHAQQTLPTVIPAQYSGSPQGRSPDETGPHGCLLVKVTGDQIDDSLLIETDALRYRTERIDVTKGDDRSTLIAKMKSRLQTMRQDVNGQTPLLVTWEIVDDGPLGRQLRQDHEHESFLSQLRSETQSANVKNVWTIGVRSLRGAMPSHLFDEDSLGRRLSYALSMAWKTRASRYLNLQSYLPDTPSAHQLDGGFSKPDTSTATKEVTTRSDDRGYRLACR